MFATISAFVLTIKRRIEGKTPEIHCILLRVGHKNILLQVYG